MAGPAYFSGTMNIAKNEDWIVPFVYQTNDLSPVPIDLTGSTLELQIRSIETSHTAVVATSSPSNGITIDNAAAGQFTITIANAEATDITIPSSIRLYAGQPYVSDLVRVTATGDIERIFEVQVTVVEGTTR